MTAVGVTAAARCSGPTVRRAACKDEFEQLAAEHPDITKLVTIGQTVQGEDIVALKVSRDASRTP